MTEPIETIHEFVAAFVSAWPEHDAGRLGQFFSEDAVYHNMPMEPVHGRESILATLGEFMNMGGRVEVDLLNIAASGATVMTERVDRFMDQARTVSLPVVGIYEVNGGKISAWRDYFDLAQFTSQMPDRTTGPSGSEASEEVDNHNENVTPIDPEIRRVLEEFSGDAMALATEVVQFRAEHQAAATVGESRQQIILPPPPTPPDASPPARLGG